MNDADKQEVGLILKGVLNSNHEERIRELEDNMRKNTESLELLGNSLQHVMSALMELRDAVSEESLAEASNERQT